MSAIQHNKPTHTPRPELMDVLNAVGEMHSDKVSQIKDSKTLLKLGVKNEAAQFWEGVMNNPLATLYNTGIEVDKTFINFVHDIVKSYFISNKKFIKKAFRTNQGLHYSIILKNDTLENRTKINTFFSNYFDLPFSKKYQVYFQFVPAALQDKLVTTEEII